MRKEFFVLGLVGLFVLGCDPNANPTDVDGGIDGGTVADANSVQDADLTAQVCKDNCGTFWSNNVKYDCPVACPISQTCGDVKHKCCVEIQNKLDLFCRYYPYFNSTFIDAGSTPSHDSATRIPSPEEVGFLYCSYPGFVNCSQY